MHKNTKTVLNKNSVERGQLLVERLRVNELFV